MNVNNWKEILAKIFFLFCALLTCFSLFLICFLIVQKGLPALSSIGIFDFLFGTKWSPDQKSFGILYMILASIFTTAIAATLAGILGKWCAIYLVFYCNKKLYKIIKPMIELLAGIPSVVYGFLGAVIIVPFISNNIGGSGKSMLAAIIILVIMVLPTIVNLIEVALKSVPKSYYEAAIALGTTHDEAVFNVVVKSAKSSIISAYVLGIGRILGETMAIVLVSGNSPRLPLNILKPVRTLTTGIVIEIGYASGLHQQALFGIGIVLFVLIFILNLFLLKFKN